MGLRLEVDLAANAGVLDRSQVDAGQPAHGDVVVATDGAFRHGRNDASLDLVLADQAADAAAPAAADGTAAARRQDRTGVAADQAANRRTRSGADPAAGIHVEQFAAVVADEPAHQAVEAAAHVAARDRMGDGTAEVVSNQPADATVAAAADLARRLGGLDGTLAVVADQPAQIRAPLVHDAAAGFQVSEHAVAFCLADQPSGRQAALAVHRPARLRAEYLAAGTQADQPAGIPRAAGLHLAAGATIGDVAEHVVADQAADVQAGPVGLDLPLAAGRPDRGLRIQSDQAADAAQAVALGGLCSHMDVAVGVLDDRLRPPGGGEVLPHQTADRRARRISGDAAADGCVRDLPVDIAPDQAAQCVGAQSAADDRDPAGADVGDTPAVDPDQGAERRRTGAVGVIGYPQVVQFQVAQGARGAGEQPDIRPGVADREIAYAVAETVQGAAEDAGGPADGLQCRAVIAAAQDIAAEHVQAVQVLVDRLQLRQVLHHRVVIATGDVGRVGPGQGDRRRAVHPVAFAGIHGQRAASPAENDLVIDIDSAFGLQLQPSLGATGIQPAIQRQVGRGAQPQPVARCPAHRAVEVQVALGRNQFDIGARQVPRQGVGMNGDAIRHRRRAHVDLVGSNLPGTVEAIAGERVHLGAQGHLHRLPPDLDRAAVPRSVQRIGGQGASHHDAVRAAIEHDPPVLAAQRAGLDGTLGVHHRVEQRIGGPGRHQDSPPVGLEQTAVACQRIGDPGVDADVEQLVAVEIQRQVAARTEPDTAHLRQDRPAVVDLRAEQGDAAAFRRGDGASLVEDTVGRGTRETVSGGVAVELGIRDVQRGSHQAADIDLGAATEEHAVGVDQEDLAVGIDPALDIAGLGADHPIQGNRATARLVEDHPLAGGNAEGVPVGDELVDLLVDRQAVAARQVYLPVRAPADHRSPAWQRIGRSQGRGAQQGQDGGDRRLGAGGLAAPATAFADDVPAALGYVPDQCIAFVHVLPSSSETPRPIRRAVLRQEPNSPGPAELLRVSLCRRVAALDLAVIPHRIEMDPRRLAGHGRQTQRGNGERRQGDAAEGHGEVALAQL
ncbi:Uncharacterised protein [Klebsiella pneumoniae]|nr:Uncharacterised protein [Klebsiella pneumoniae]